MKKLLMILSVLLVSACAPAERTDDGKVTVYTSFYAMYDFTKQLAGDTAAVENLVPVGVEPHDWEPSPEDIVKLEQADVFVYSGKGMESWCEQVLGTLENQDLIVVEAAKDVPKLTADGAVDPHVWLDPANARIQMEAIADALVQADPANEAAYRERLAGCTAQLEQLDAAYREQLAACPRKDIIVSHAAYGYLCNAYGLQQTAIEGLAADSDASPARLAEIVDLIRANDIHYIFFEELVQSKAVDTLIQETGVEALALSPFEGDAEGRGYFTVMEENLENLVTALQ